MTRRLSASGAGILLAGTLLLAGCGKPETAVEKADKEQVLIIGNGTEPEDLDPQVVTGVPEDNILRALFEGLVSQDPHDLHAVPGTAESWDISPDGRVYTFHLRKDAKWTDGEPVTSDDFLQSYKRILSPALAAEYNYMLFPVVNAEAYSKGDLKDFSKVGFRAPDARTLEVTLNNPTPYFLSLLNHYSWFAVPVHTVLKFGKLDSRGTPWTRPGNMVSNGPFRLKDWKTNSVIAVEKNPGYWDKDTVRLKAILFLPIDNSSAEERAFRSGQLHITNTVPLPKIDAYRKNEPSLFRNDPYLGTYFYRINVTKPFLKQKELRQALSLAIDRESIVKNVTRGGERPATSFTPADTAGYFPKPVLHTDIPAAKALLAKAGYPDGKGLPPIEIPLQQRRIAPRHRRGAPGDVEEEPGRRCPVDQPGVESLSRLATPVELPDLPRRLDRRLRGPELLPRHVAHRRREQRDRLVECRLRPAHSRGGPHHRPRGAARRVPEGRDHPHG